MNNNEDPTHPTNIRSRWRRRTKSGFAMRAQTQGRPAGVPSSYDRGGSTRWTPEAISEVHALAQLGRYQVRGYNTFNKQMPTFDDLDVCAGHDDAPAAGRVPREVRDQDDPWQWAWAWWKSRLSWISRSTSRRCPFGALSASAKASLGHGASKVGTMTCTGEGGMLEEERAAAPNAPAVSDVASTLRR